MTQFRNRPIIIEAWRFADAIVTPDAAGFPVWLTEAMTAGVVRFYRGPVPRVSILTLEGPMFGGLGDWIIQGIKGEIYVCREDIFHLTYEPA